jgi:diacylglycerol kinase (ATP)
VLGLELMNTALENLVDLVTRERLPLAGKIKDIAAGAVFIASFMAAVVGVLIFRKYILI